MLHTLLRGKALRFLVFGDRRCGDDAVELLEGVDVHVSDVELRPLPFAQTRQLVADAVCVCVLYAQMCAWCAYVFAQVRGVCASRPPL